MPGKSKNTSQAQNFVDQTQTGRASNVGTSLGTTTGTTTGSAVLNPFGPSGPLLEDIINRAGGLISPDLTGRERAGIEGIAGAGNIAAGFVPEATGLIGDMISGRGGVGAYGQTVSDAFTPIARGDFLDPATNPVLQNAIARGQNQAQNAVTSRFAAGGRSFSPAEARAMGEGIADVNADLTLGMYGTEVGRQMNAANILGNAARAAEASRTGGLGLLPAITGLETMPFQQQLQAAGMERGIPVQNLGMISDLILPIASTFGERATEGTTTGQTGGYTTSTGDTSSTGRTVGTTVGSQTQKANPWQVGIGTALATLGLLKGGSGMPDLSFLGGGGGGGSMGAPVALGASQGNPMMLGALY